MPWLQLNNYYSTVTMTLKVALLIRHPAKTNDMTIEVLVLLKIPPVIGPHKNRTSCNLQHCKACVYHKIPKKVTQFESNCNWA